VDGVRQLSLEGGVLRCGVPASSLDALVKALASFQVLDVAITEADLEEMFLTYYVEASSDAA